MEAVSGSELQRELVLVLVLVLAIVIVLDTLSNSAITWPTWLMAFDHEKLDVCIRTKARE